MHLIFSILLLQEFKDFFLKITNFKKGKSIIISVYFEEISNLNLLKKLTFLGYYFESRCSQKGADFLICLSKVMIILV